MPTNTNPAAETLTATGTKVSFQSYGGRFYRGEVAQGEHDYHRMGRCVIVRVYGGTPTRVPVAMLRPFEHDYFA